MTQHFWLEIVGYLGSSLLVISLMMKSILRLRLINLIGVIVFTVYGLLIKAYPIAILNGLLIFIDSYFVIQILRKKDFFTMLEVSYNSEYLHSFVEFYWSDIRKAFPNYNHNNQGEHLSFFVLRNMVPAGVLIANRNNDEAEIVLDFVIPGYRDFGVGKFIFQEKAGYFLKTGIHRFVTRPDSKKHIQYLKRVGFKKKDNMFVQEMRADIILDSTM